MSDKEKQRWCKYQVCRFKMQMFLNFKSRTVTSKYFLRFLLVLKKVVFLLVSKFRCSAFGLASDMYCSNIVTDMSFVLFGF